MRSDLEEQELTAIKGLSITGRVRTIADLGRRQTPAEALVALDMALQRRLITIDELTSWIGSHRGYRGLRRLREACELAEPAESPMETRLRLLLVSNGLPRPRVQASIYDDSGGFIARPDLYFPDQHLAIEYDGSSHRTSLVADNRRQNRILEAGYRLLRFTASDIFLRPASVVSQTRKALSAAATPA